METLQEYDPIRADYLSKIKHMKATPANVDQFTDETFHAQMKKIDEKHINLGEGVDLGQKMKVMAG